MDLGEYISQLDAPSNAGIPRQTPEDFGAGTARALGGLAKEVIDYDQAFRAQADDIQRANDMAAIDVSARKQMKDLEASLEQDPDWQTYDKRWADGFSKIKTSLMSGINDPQVKRAATVHLGNLEGNGVTRAAGRSRQLAADSFDAFRLTSRKNALDTVSTAADPDDENSAIGIHLGVIASQEQGGWLPPDKAEKERQDFVQDILVYRAKRDILADPGVYFRKKQEGAYTGVDLYKAELLDAQAVRQVEHNDRVAERQAKKFLERNDAIFLAGVENGTLTDAAADDAFLGPSGDPDFQPLISAAAYKEGKVKLAVRRREGGPRNPGVTDTIKMHLSLNPGRYSDREITSLHEKGLNPTDVLDILEYKRARIKDLQEMPPGSHTGLEMIKEAVPRGLGNEMNNKVRKKIIDAEQEYIYRIKKSPEKWFQIASEISNRYGAIKSGMTPAEEEALRRELNEAGGTGPGSMMEGPPDPSKGFASTASGRRMQERVNRILDGVPGVSGSAVRGVARSSFLGNLLRSLDAPDSDITP